MIAPARVLELLIPFDLTLAPAQIDLLQPYLELLLKWNAKINLVGPASAEDCVTRHFGESLFLIRCADPRGSLLDIGSGAGFPGLALKILRPELDVTLLEPVAKKRAFLKEVTRVCGFERIHILADRLEDFAAEDQGPRFEFATSRAVGDFEVLASYSAACLVHGGSLCLWLGHDDARTLMVADSPFEWRPPIAIPLSHRRQILVGRFVR